MAGMNAETGRVLDGVPLLRQHIRDVLTTRIGTRVGRREYGSDLPNLVDRPVDKAGALELYAATAEAVGRWVPQFRMASVRIAGAAPGAVTLELRGDHVPTGDDVAVTVGVGGAG